MRRISILMAAAVGGAAALLTSGCTSTPVAGTTRAAGASSALRGAEASSPPATSSAAASPGAPARRTATTTATTANPAVQAAGPPECRNHDLKVSETSDSGYEGHAAANLTFTNISGHLCVLRGYPGAELVDAAGRPLLNATRTLDGYIDASVIASSDPGITAPPRVRLAPGADALATLEWVLDTADGGTATGCRVQHSSGLLVTPPDSTDSTAFPGLSGVCATFVIGPVLDDTRAG